VYVDGIAIALDYGDWAKVAEIAGNLQKAATLLSNDTLAQFARTLNDAVSGKVIAVRSVNPCILCL